MYVDALEKEFETDTKWLDIVLVELGWPAYDPDGWEGARGLVLRELGNGLYSRVGMFAFRYRTVKWVKKEDLNEKIPESPVLGLTQFALQGKQSRNTAAMEADCYEREDGVDEDIPERDVGSEVVGHGKNDDGVDEEERGNEELSNNPSPLGLDKKPLAKASKQDDELAAERELQTQIWEEQRNFFDKGEHKLFLLV
jgi:hypothetical protein